ncbi:cytochrome c oxidase-assembly factor cox23, mitochondrial precursor, putative [Talaromyces stipitatus ATCC 10500]|uniref:Cytochrome c oxidase-assembly factor cox23, mitochondrial, putative n=1 Tax=Talaromyces stipitatus (strain ATCC 10500 / CBS 375.48 / QM 6759 / NRRL 1006) TaxID=441959 RepID=B8MKB8_TALSN|nr:cytochrome c oxidase-assembly factor cox23, mitochondrial precursor, putative [Talaromyces stipitatus ATCC 10500]EED15273.1 cytochrome c oxidase-assembly factor cox23, mitochondrial precursor, putative [Talaromyces stipitatus ATCC 10500]
MASTTKEEETSSWSKAEKKFENKSASEYYDPCQAFADRSIRCMRRNAGDREMCGDYFQAYRDCKKEWLNSRKLTRVKAFSEQQAQQAQQPQQQQA